MSNVTLIRWETVLQTGAEGLKNVFAILRREVRAGRPKVIREED